MLDDDENGVARLTHAFGVNANVQDAVICTDEVGVLLPVGRMISLFSWESRAMSFVSGVAPRPRSASAEAAAAVPRAGSWCAAR